MALEQYGNTTTYNLETVLRENIIRSQYWEKTCLDLEGWQEVVDEVYYRWVSSSAANEDAVEQKRLEKEGRFPLSLARLLSGSERGAPLEPPCPLSSWCRLCCCHRPD